MQHVRSGNLLSVDESSQKKTIQTFANCSFKAIVSSIACVETKWRSSTSFMAHEILHPSYASADGRPNFPQELSRRPMLARRFRASCFGACK